MQLAALFLLFLQLAPLAPAPLKTGEKASIEGVVLRSGSGEPLARTELRLTRVLPEGTERSLIFGIDLESEGLPKALTESDWKFFLTDLEPGQYRLTAYRNGYAEQPYGRKGSSGSGTIISLIAGERFTNVVFRLVPAGVITGRVREESGEPVPGFSVGLMKVSSNGERPYLYPEDSAMTNDRGEYRFYWVPPGRYYLRVSRPQQQFSNRRVVFDRTSAVAAFYPGVVDAASAAAIDLTPGAEISGIDITIPRASGHKISGRIIDGSTGKPPEGASVSIDPRKTAQFEFAFEERYESQYNSTTGEFEILNVPPGAYLLSAASQPKFDSPITPEQLAEFRTGADVFQTVFYSVLSTQISIDLNASDMTDVVLTLSKGVTIPVRLAIEGAELQSLKGADDIRVSLAPETNGPYRQGTRVNAEGNARIDQVHPGHYRVDVSHPPTADLYVKEVLYGRSDVLHSPIEITDQTPNAVTVLLSTKGGQVEGRLTDALSQPVSGGEVVLVGDDRGGNLTKTATTDREGRFTFRALPPGGYKLFSWEVVEDGSIYTKSFLAKYETQGRPVRVEESSKVTADLKIIPAPAQ
jgi:hypothetical protein